MEYKKCFIISSQKQYILGVVDLLRDKGINIIHPLLDFGVNLIDSLENAIKESDFVFCIVNQNTDKNQLFELGLARGLQKPIFLVAEDDNLLPFSINNFIYVKARIDDINAISYNLEYFLQNTKRKKTVVESKKTKVNVCENIPDINLILSKIYEPNISEYDMLSMIENLLLNYQDITVVSQNRNINKGADLAIWIDDLELILGGPILIELKNRAKLSNDFFIKAKNQMLSYLHATNSPVGIIVYNGDSKKCEILDNSQLPLVIYMELKTFIYYITERKLARFLIEKRNKAAHRGDLND